MTREQIHSRRWAILGVLILALFGVTLDNTILNIALPTLARDLDATSGQLQWLVDAYVLLGRVDDATRLFERLLGLRSDLGLLSEEYDTASRRLIGNFPQAFSHIALINSAQNLTRGAKPAEQRASG